MAGIFTIESVKGIQPKHPSTTTSLVIIAVAVVVKIVLGRFVRARDVAFTQIRSLPQDQTPSLMPYFPRRFCRRSFYVHKKISLEAYVGVVISGFIIKAAVEMLHGSMKEIIGMRSIPSFPFALLKL